MGSVENFDVHSWEKKIVKIFKALQVMERHKLGKPFLSNSFTELATYLNESMRQSERNTNKSGAKSDYSRLSIYD